MTAVPKSYLFYCVLYWAVSFHQTVEDTEDDGCCPRVLPILLCSILGCVLPPDSGRHGGRWLLSPSPTYSIVFYTGLCPSTRQWKTRRTMAAVPSPTYSIVFYTGLCPSTRQWKTRRTMAAVPESYLFYCILYWAVSFHQTVEDTEDDGCCPRVLPILLYSILGCVLPPDSGRHGGR